jgi:hypothetical protein
MVDFSWFAAAEFAQRFALPARAGAHPDDGHSISV